MAEEDEVLALAVAEDSAGARLDRALAAALPQFSRARLQALIRDGRVRVGARTIVEPDYRVNAGEAVSIAVPAPVAADPLPEAIALEVLYEDDALIVLDKPAGLVVHPGAGTPSGTLVNALLHHCAGRLSGIGGIERPGIVHRLDKGTSGLMVVAKTDAAHRDLSAQFADHGRTGPLERGYLALVWGMPRAKGTVSAPIGRSPRFPEKMAVRRDGRPAVTRYARREVFASSGGAPVASLVECRLETGRTHQIRVHMTHIGHPLLGDATYGAGFASKRALLSAQARDALDALDRQALHAYLLGFRHPASGEIMHFERDPPADLASLVNTLHGT